MLNNLLVKTHLIILLLAVLTIAPFSAHTETGNEITLMSIDDSRHKLSDYIGQGKWVVLNIWGTGCPPCREEMPELVNFHDQHKDSKAIVVGIAIDFPSYQYADSKEVSKFADDYLIDFPILLSDARITEKLGLGRLDGLPSTYLYNPAGELKGMQVGVITAKILEEFIDKHSSTKTK